MKIIFLGKYNNSEMLTGPDKVAKSVFNRVKNYRTDVLFIEYYFEGTKYSFFKKLFGNEKFNIDGTHYQKMGLFPMLIVLIKYRPNIIHLITFERFQIIAILYHLFLNCKLVYNVHGIVTYENNKLRSGLKSYYKLKDSLFERILYRQVDYFIFLSNRSLNIAKSYYNISKKKYFIIPNGIDKILIIDKIYNEYNNQPLKLVFVGDSSRPEKGFEFLIKSLEMLKIAVELFVVGRSDIRLNLKTQNFKVSYFEKMTNSKFLQFMMEKDVFISASYYENFSISLLEAMALGLVPVMTEETGISEFITNKKNGYIFKYNNPQELLRILQNLDQNRVLLKRIGKEAQNLAKSFVWDSVVEKYYLKLYQNIWDKNECSDSSK